MIKFRQPLDMGSQRVTALGTPTASSDAATKSYVDSSATTASNTWAIATKTANYTITASDAVILANGASITITLPSASTAGAGRVYWVKNINATAATVASNGGTVDGSTTASVRQWQSLTFVSDGANWYII